VTLPLNPPPLTREGEFFSKKRGLTPPLKHP